MSTKKYDMLVFIGRFQPFHNGHKSVVDRALTLSDRVLILVGSANRTRSKRNPFTYQEREEAIRSVYPNNPNVIVHPLNDVMYGDNLWVSQVQDIVAKYSSERTGLIGCDKDHTSYYLNLFPTWGAERVDYVNPINSTQLRDMFLTYGTNAHWVSWASSPESELKMYVPKEVFAWLEVFENSDRYSWVKEEIEFIDNYKRGVAKYPRIEHTVDAVVVQSGHVLLVRRRSAPGKGNWAMPGGFINPEEKLVDAMIRELKEETKIKVPEPVLRGSIIRSKTFDDPHRSDRARIITQAFYIKLQDQRTLPKVKGADDADKAVWVPISELDPKNMFEDHYFIIKNLIGED